MRQFVNTVYNLHNFLVNPVKSCQEGRQLSISAGGDELQKIRLEMISSIFDPM